MPDRKQLLAQLQSFSEAQFSEVVFLLQVPPAYLQGETAALNTKIIDLIRYAEQSEDGLHDLVGCIQQVLAKPDLPGFENLEGLTPPKLQLSRLPTTHAQLFGREDELELLQQAWQNPKINIVVLQAFGGMGKTALMQHWLDGFTQANDYHGAQRIFTWSFYSQGTAEDRQASADEFFDKALEWFGHDGSVIPSAHDKGVKLADLVRRRRTLLLLDGLEPLQYPEGAMEGRLRDKGVESLCKHLAAGMDGLLLISSRQPIVELQGKPQVLQHELAPLSLAAAQALFADKGIVGTAQEFAAVVKEYDGHALSLSLLAQYLSDYADGDIRQRDTLRELGDFPEQTRSSRHAFKVMQAYERQLQGTPDLQLLYMLGLFDRPVADKTLAHLRQNKNLPGLKDLEGLPGDDRIYKAALKRLQRQQLLNRSEDNTVLDCHPLVRQFFARRLRDHYPDAWQQAHEALFEYYQVLPEKHQPDTLDEMQPLFAAVAHGCAAGLHQRALDEVYWARIRREDDNYLCNKLGAFGAELAVVAHFFEQPWYTPARSLEDFWKAQALNWAGFRLRALGRQAEAVQPTQVAMDLFVAQENWKDAAINANNLSELHLSNGTLSAALQAAQQSVELADRSEVWGEQSDERTTLADVQHQVGKFAASHTSFTDAEVFHQENQPEYPQLYSLQGFRYCDLLLTLGEWPEVQRRAQQILEWDEPFGRLLDIGLPKLSLGRTSLQHVLAEMGIVCINEVSYTDSIVENIPLAADYHVLPDTVKANDASLSALREAEDWLQQAVDSLRQAGDEMYLPHSLLARASLHRFALSLAPQTDSLSNALRDLEETRDIAERSGMLLFLTDYHLEACRLALTIKDSVHGLSAAQHFAEAQARVTKIGYGRRRPEVAYLAKLLNA